MCALEHCSLPCYTEYMASYDKLNNVSSTAIKKATGNDWNFWVDFIDRHGGRDMAHSEIVAMLSREKAIENSWWQQMVTVGYEYAIGRRVVGETATAGFQLGVQKTVRLRRDRLWQLLFSRKGLAVWLGDVQDFMAEPGKSFGGTNLPRGEVRSMKLGEMIRLSMQTVLIQHPFTFQIYLICPRNTNNKTSLRFHFEKLHSSQERELLREHAKSILEGLIGLSESG